MPPQGHRSRGIRPPQDSLCWHPTPARLSESLPYLGLRQARLGLFRRAIATATAQSPSASTQLAPHASAPRHLLRQAASYLVPSHLGPVNGSCQDACSEHAAGKMTRRQNFDRKVCNKPWVNRRAFQIEKTRMTRTSFVKWDCFKLDPPAVGCGNGKGKVLLGNCFQ